MSDSPWVRRILAALATFGIVAAASAQQTDARSARYLAANCANCHGTQGLSAGTIPGLAGQKKDLLAEQMRAFRDGRRSATVMHQIAKGYTDAQIDLIAEHFARQPAK